MSDRPHMHGALLAGLLLAWLALGWLGASTPRQALTSYLMAWIALVGLPLGSLAWLMIHALTGGAWGDALREEWIDTVRLLPCALALSLPLLLGAAWLFPWVQPEHAAAWPIFYLNLPFFYARCALCFACWFALACGVLWRLTRPSERWPGHAAAGLILMLLSVSIWAVDWIMSRVEGWHSTALGLTLFAAQLMSSLAFALWLRLRRGGFRTPRVQQDAANLLLVAVLGWSYLAFMDYLTAWISDLPADTAWYLPRLRTHWQWLGGLLLALQTALPIALLLLRAVKRHAPTLRALAGLLLIMQVCYAAWLILPDARPAGAMLAWIDPLALFCVLGTAWCVTALRQQASHRTKAEWEGAEP